MYIFGYGSLMNSSSRKLTGQTGEAIPAIVSGLVRYWGKVDDSYSASPLVSDIGEGIVNGVLLEISPSDLIDFDSRERGYKRIKLLAEQIETAEPINESSEVWVYVKENPEPPCEDMPVLQTYIDTVLSGCLEISEEFAHLFIKHTEGWTYPIFNDRHQPRYGNYAGISAAHESLIDKLLLIQK
ncbi:gamma-glutamylcyclotransferase family protein [Vibrio viridaestus]|uniref:Gamma-glutamylcyclotransferase n=1 Tax=Vibrio viridaestus TaxID=2487322 RepID=A0A3N9TGS1_9VIBR|nr:gamma-glutamylcyclotransferase family protein [Vibrio viridaestus]RQW63104.1 gamma-glutamylcyclotransferase [Vibrio viridaestus]